MPPIDQAHEAFTQVETKEPITSKFGNTLDARAQENMTILTNEIAEATQSVGKQYANDVQNLAEKVAIMFSDPEYAKHINYQIEDLDRSDIFKNFITANPASLPNFAGATQKQLNNYRLTEEIPTIKIRQKLHQENKTIDKLKNAKEEWDKTVEKWDEVNEKLKAEIEIKRQKVENAKKSKADTISKNGLKVASAEDLDASLTTPDQQIAFATEQLGYDQAQATEIVQNYQNSQYSEAWLSIGQLLSFLQTEQALWNNGIDSDPFLADVAQIRDDLQISAPKTKKRNLTCSQIQFFVM